MIYKHKITLYKYINYLQATVDQSQIVAGPGDSMFSKVDGQGGYQ
jgi:hypothetical protein